MMRVLIATPLLPPDIGGPATYSALLARALPERGFGVRIANFGSVRFLPRGIRHAAYFFLCVRHALGADIVYAQDPVSVGFPAALAAALLRKTFLLKVVGDYAWEQFQAHSSAFVSPDNFGGARFGLATELRRQVERWVARRASAIVVPSRYLEGVVRRWGVSPDVIRVIPNAIDAIRCPLSSAEARKKLGLSGTVLVSAGRLVPWKGFGTLIRIIPDILRVIPDATLVIAGDGPERRGLERSIQAQGMQSRVRLVGRISRRELAEYLRAADCFVLNTGYEGLSHQVLEALSLGVPVVTTAIGGNPEVIRDGENGILVRYDDSTALRDAIVRVVRDPALQTRLAENGRKTIGAFTEDRMLTSLSALLGTL